MENGYDYCAYDADQSYHKIHHCAPPCFAVWMSFKERIK